jgi:pantetheine-phosphate adenylyltransferase
MAQRAEHALFPGSFDPVTLGHVDLVERALGLFGRVPVLVAQNAKKPGFVAVEERADLLARSLAHLGRIEVKVWPGLVVDAAREFGCDAIVRGVRSGTDFDFEVAMARTNRALAPGLDTILLAPSPAFAHVSSSLVREIELAGGDASIFVPKPVADAFRARRAPAQAPAGTTTRSKPRRDPRS